MRAGRRGEALGPVSTLGWPLAGRKPQVGRAGQAWAELASLTRLCLSHLQWRPTSSINPSERRSSQRPEDTGLVTCWQGGSWTGRPALGSSGGA